MHGTTVEITPCFFFTRNSLRTAEFILTRSGIAVLKRGGGD